MEDFDAQFAEISKGQNSVSQLLLGNRNPELLGQLASRARASRDKLRAILDQETVVLCGSAVQEPAVAAILGDRKYELVSIRDFDKLADRVNIIISPHHAFFQNPELVEVLKAQRERPDFVSAVQFRDHHHSFERNLQLAHVVDFVFPGHYYRFDYFLMANLNVLASIPMCCGQWSEALLRATFAKAAEAPRSDALYGGYGYYPGAFLERTKFIDDLGSQIEGSKVMQWRPGQGDSYLQLSPEDKLSDWLGHKVSIVVNTDFCIPNRIFDALVTGQIPLVPDTILHLEEIIPAELQESLPVIRYRQFDLESAKDAYHRALEAFERGGVEGIWQRHRHAMTRHLYKHRFVAMLKELDRVKKQLL